MHYLGDQGNHPHGEAYTFDQMPAVICMLIETEVYSIYTKE